MNRVSNLYLEFIIGAVVAAPFARRVETGVITLQNEAFCFSRSFT